MVCTLQIAYIFYKLWTLCTWYALNTLRSSHALYTLPTLRTKLRQHPSYTLYKFVFSRPARTPFTISKQRRIRISLEFYANSLHKQLPALTSLGDWHGQNLRRPRQKRSPHKLTLNNIRGYLRPTALGVFYMLLHNFTKDVRIVHVRLLLTFLIIFYV